MKNIKIILGSISLIWMVISALSYWGTIWGALGFFGAIIVLPMSVFMFFVYTSLNGYLLQNLIWIAITVWLFYE